MSCEGEGEDVTLILTHPPSGYERTHARTIRHIKLYFSHSLMPSISRIHSSSEFAYTMTNRIFFRSVTYIYIKQRGCH